MKKFIIIITLFLYYKISYANETKVEMKLYKDARRKFLKENYEESKSMFESLLETQNNTELEAYILFYYALALYHCDELDEAIKALQDIKCKYPEWENLKEIWYWLGLFHFERQRYESALEALSHFSDHDKSIDIHKLKFYFLNKCDDIDIIENLLNNYPKDILIAKVLIKKLSQDPISKRRIWILEKLAKNFGLYPEDVIEIQSLYSVKKKSYNVAVFLPFFVEQLKEDKTAEIDFVLSLYQGIKLAVSELENSGIQINLYAYDTNRNPALIANLLDKDEMRFMDAIIGPLYPEEIPLISDFSKKFKIPLFNPLSDNLELIDNNPFCFLYQPSIQTKAINAAKHTLATAALDAKIGIIYSTNKAEILAANIYKNYIERNSTHKIDVTIGIESSNCSTFLNYYLKKNKQDFDRNSYPYATIEGLTHLYVPSKDEVIAASVISATAIANNRVNIIADASWLYHESIALDQILGLKIAFLSPSYIDYKKANIYEFRSKFMEEFADFPDSYAMKGYALMFFLGRILNSYGANFISEFRINAAYDTNIFSQLRYGLNHDNQIVPIIEIDKDGYFICYGNQ